MQLVEYLSLIETLPVKNHSFTIQKTNWFNKVQELEIGNIFENKSSITLNRYDLISAAHHNTKDFILKTLMWGYPTKGRGNNIDNLLEINNFEKLVQKLDSYRGINISSKVLESDLKEISGLGLSTMSKFLYFMGAKVENQTTLILDRKIIEILRTNSFVELKDLSNLNYPASITNYVEYLKVINNLAEINKVENEKIEMFIFIFGKHLSPLSGEECYDDFSEYEKPKNKNYRDFIIQAINNLTISDQNIFTDTLNILMEGEFKEIDNVFDTNDTYKFSIEHLENSKDKNVKLLVELLKKVENTISILKTENGIQDEEIITE
jgi:hypothetical protein